MRRFTGGLVSVALLVGALAGCGSGGDGKDAKEKRADKAAGEKADAPSGSPESPKERKPAGPAKFGEPGSACELPVTFEPAKGWKVTELSGKTAEFMGRLTEHKSVRAVCNLDAKPTGVLGTMTLWTAPRRGDSPRKVMETFVTEAKRHLVKQEYRDITVAGLPAVEAVYVLNSPLMDEDREQRAFAVNTPKGAFVVALGGVSTGEHRKMLPGYELVKRTLTPLGG
ncbi:lipoprotein [Streptomyces luteireticuli]|uniref:Lipoprotein n=1 Tax=Streptomyces luteireticuli TaxID=173858 RepID=A0ABN0YIC6_9ACTN